MIDVGARICVYVTALCIFHPIFRYLVARWSSDYVIRAVEDGSIDLSFLLDEGGVFDELSDRVVKRFKHNALAELGTMTRTAGSAEQVAASPELMGLDAAGQLLQMVGMKKPPAMLQYKVAEALGRLVAQQGAPVDDFEQFKP